MMIVSTSFLLLAEASLSVTLIAGDPSVSSIGRAALPSCESSPSVATMMGALGLDGVRCWRLAGVTGATGAGGATAEADGAGGVVGTADTTGTGSTTGVKGISRNVGAATAAGVRVSAAAVEFVLRLLLFRSTSVGDRAVGVPEVGVVEADAAAAAATTAAAKGVVWANPVRAPLSLFFMCGHPS